MPAQMAPNQVARILGANIRARRLQLRMTQQELADDLGTYDSYVSAIESGNKNVSLPRLADWAAALKTTAAALLREPK